MDFSLTIQSVVQTGVIGLVITTIAIILHLILYLLGMHSSKSKLLTSFLLMSFCLIAKYFNYPISSFIDHHAILATTYTNVDNAVKTIIFLSISTIITSGLNYFIWEDNATQSTESMSPKLIINILNTLIHLLFILIIMKVVFNLNISNIVAASGLGVFILGWSAKPTLTEFFAGLAIQLGKKLKKGALIQIDHIEGLVKDFNWRSISITPVTSTGRIMQNETHIIPNSSLQSKTITVLKQPNSDKIRLTGSCYISPYCNLSKAFSLMKNSLLEHATDEDITLSFNADNRDNYSLDFITTINGLKNKLFFSQAFTASLLHRFHKKGLPIGQARLPWSIDQDLEETVPQQCLSKGPAREEILNQLTAVHLLKPLSHDDINYLIDNTTLEFFLANEFIIHERVKDEHCLHVIISGSATAFTHDKENRRIETNQFNETHCFGLKAFLLDTPRRISVLATQPTWCLKISRNTMSPIFNNCPLLAESLSQLLTDRTQQSDSSVQQYILDNQTQHEETHQMFMRKIKALFS